MPTATPFNNLITFSRGSNATVTGSNGLIQWAPNNLLTFSEQFDNAAWSTYFVTVAANTTVAPDGSRTADTLTFAPSVIDYHSVFRTVAVAAGLLYTTSVYAKAGTTSVFSMEFRGSSSAPDVVFNLANGTVTSGTGTITPVGDGWYRCSVTKTSVDASELIIFGTGLISAAGTIFLWGAQLELGSTATTYNPTTVKNLISFSEAFDNAGWTKGNASVVTGAQANPINGLFNAQKLMENTANAQHLLSQNYVAGAGIYTYSIYVKAAERDIFGFNRTDIGGFSASYNLTTGTVRSISGFTNAQIIPVGGGWYRVSCMLTLAAGTTIGFGVQPYNAVGSTVYTGDGNSGLYIYGAQLSDSASLDPYVPAPGLTASSTAFYGPRFDFDPVTLQPRGILIEEQRTNLTTYSEQFDNVAWAKNNVQIVPNQDPAAATLGAELCINGDFASATGWTANAGWVISGGQATGTATSSSLFGGQMTTIAGRVYRVDFDVVSYTSGDLLVTVGANYDGQVRLTGMSAGRRTVYVVGGTVTTRGVEFYGGSVTCSIDNVSVREVIGGALLAPDGTASADTILATNTAAAGLVRSFASTAVAYTYSVYLKQGNTTFSEIEIIDQGTVANRVRLTYATGVLTVVSGSPTGTAASVGNGWWRVTITYTFPAIGAADTLVIYPSTTTGSIGQYCFAWGAQLEIGAFAASYIPTVASTVTRSADVATINGSLFSQWYSQTAGSFVAEWALANANTTGRYIVKAFSPSVAQGYGLWVNSNSIDTRAWIGATSITAGNASLTVANKASMGYRAGDNAASVNGAAAVTSSATGPTDATYLEIGSAGASYLNGHIRNIRFIPARAADFQLQALTT